MQKHHASYIGYELYLLESTNNCFSQLVSCVYVCMHVCVYVCVCVCVCVCVVSGAKR